MLYSLYSSASHMWLDFSPCSCSQIHARDRTYTHVQDIQRNSGEDDSSRRRLRGHWLSPHWASHYSRYITWHNQSLYRRTRGCLTIAIEKWEGKILYWGRGFSPGSKKVLLFTDKEQWPLSNIKFKTAPLSCNLLSLLSSCNILISSL